MNQLSSISSYIVSMQQLQLNIIKQNIETQKQLTEIIIDSTRLAPTSDDKGTNLDISV